jgi:hypothetical protein
MEGGPACRSGSRRLTNVKNSESVTNAETLRGPSCIPETSGPVLGVSFLSFAFLALKSSFLGSLGLDLPFLLESSVTLPFGGL